ncbi:CAP domain-containing protein [Nocardioides caeni]|uniref:CAP domain-containing protein n=1 Tax=Nocardioides caeni TaxID=574700 RepID=A0A4S8MZI8_9ACTN|nr:CAP domain-containing protein [Nocardioides caeni]THV08755.1 CAP domain-containing protein [Nocardioides caeni]
MLSGGFKTFVTSMTIAAAVVAGLVAGPGHGTATAASAASPVSTASAPTTARTIAVVDALLETTVLTLTNLRRVVAGCAPLRFNRELRTAARRHSARMANNATMSHRLAGEPTLGTRITRAGYTDWRLVAENVAAGFDSARWVLRAWWLSPAHRRNIKNCRLRELGVGVVLKDGQLWWTQNFGRR